MYKFFKKQLPTRLQALFKFNYNIHNYNTRTSTNVSSKTQDINFSTHTIRYTCATNWNKLPGDIRNSTTLICIQKLLNTYGYYLSKFVNCYHCVVLYLGS